MDQNGQACLNASGQPAVDNNNIGSRMQASAVGETTGYGITGDVMGPLLAASFDSNPNQTYQVTYVCKNGGWVLTHQEGSCVPIPEHMRGQP